MNPALFRTLAEGLACHERGRLQDAADLYGTVLERDPGAADAWHLMGRIWLSQREWARAQACVLKAIELRPDLPAFPNTLGEVLAAAGRRREALVCYRQALQLDGRFVAAWVNLGLLHQAEGRLEEAADAYARALEVDPGCAEALNNLGNTLRSQGRDEEATACYREALRRRPASPEAAVNMAALCLRQRREQEAEAWARRALEVRPGLTEALSNLAMALLDQQRYPEAEQHARQAVAQAPAMAHLHSNLASVLLHQKRWEEAERECRRALELQPGHPEASLNLGVILQATDRLEEAAAQLHDVLEADPASAAAWANLGTVRAAEARHDAALFCFEDALRHQPDHAKAHFCHSLELLGRGRMEEGFAEYEWRWKVARPSRVSAGPTWEGGSLEGRTILLYAEQGLGDTIQFARYIPLVVARGGRVVVECQPPAAPIVRSVSGVEEVILPQDALPHFDVQAALMGLPRILGMAVPPTPCRTPYIAFDEEWAQRIAARLGPKQGLWVGLAWAGNPDNGGDRRRSMPLAALAPLGAHAGAEWFSLHVGEKARQELSASGGWIKSVLSDTGGLVELAALMACLDLVITVDTMPAHLAGALGRPVWNLLCAAPDWRWGREGESSPWYPSMRLFRQSQAGDWQEVVERVSEALRGFPIQPFPGGADT